MCGYQSLFNNQRRQINITCGRRILWFIRQDSIHCKPHHCLVTVFLELMFQEIIDKLRAFSFGRVLKYIKSYTTKKMDSTKNFDKNIENTNVRKRSVPESFIEDNFHNQNINQTKKDTEDTSKTTEPNGYYKGKPYKSENTYCMKIYIQY